LFQFRNEKIIQFKKNGTKLNTKKKY